MKINEGKESRWQIGKELPCIWMNWHSWQYNHTNRRWECERCGAWKRGY